MKHTREYRILIGTCKGNTYQGFQIGQRQGPDGPVVSGAGDYVWIPDLNCAFHECHHDSSKNQIEDLYIPYDRFNQRIDVGDVIYVSRKKHDVSQARVLAYGKPFHHGCGWWERTLNLVDVNTGEKFKNSYPHASIRDYNLSPARKA